MNKQFKPLDKRLLYHGIHLSEVLLGSTLWFNKMAENAAYFGAEKRWGDPRQVQRTLQEAKIWIQTHPETELPWAFSNQMHQLMIERLMVGFSSDIILSQNLILLGGAVAQYAYGVPRITLDIDFTWKTRPDQTEKAIVISQMQVLAEQQAHIFDYHLEPVLMVPKKFQYTSRSELVFGRLLGDEPLKEDGRNDDKIKIVFKFKKEGSRNEDVKFEGHGTDTLWPVQTLHTPMGRIMVHSIPEMAAGKAAALVGRFKKKERIKSNDLFDLGFLTTSNRRLPKFDNVVKKVHSDGEMASEREIRTIARTVVEESRDIEIKNPGSFTISIENVRAVIEQGRQILREISR